MAIGRFGAGAIVIRIQDFDRVAFSGSRSSPPTDIIRSALIKINPFAVVCVGCASGCDEAVRRSFDCDRLEVFAIADHAGDYRQRLATRSAAMVKSLVSQNACLIAFPGKPCPDGVVPCDRWRSAKGSGTWGTIALAAGLGVPCMVYLRGILAPQWGDRAEMVGNKWWLILPF